MAMLMMNIVSFININNRAGAGEDGEETGESY